MDWLLSVSEATDSEHYEDVVDVDCFFYTILIVLLFFGLVEALLRTFAFLFLAYLFHPPK